MLPDARDYLSADSIIRELLRMFGPGTSLGVNSLSWAVWVPDTDNKQHMVCSGRSLPELIHNVGRGLFEREGS